MTKAERTQDIQTQKQFFNSFCQQFLAEDLPPQVSILELTRQSRL